MPQTKMTGQKLREAYRVLGVRMETAGKSFIGADSSATRFAPCSFRGPFTTKYLSETLPELPGLSTLAI